MGQEPDPKTLSPKILKNFKKTKRKFRVKFVAIVYRILDGFLGCLYNRIIRTFGGNNCEP